jgi:transketolase
MREAFFQSLVEVAEIREDIFLLTGDLGFKLFDPFRNKYPDRFFDVGVAESNMIGIAAGLALSGKTVYCYSIIPFLVMRPFEQIRVDVAYQDLNVRLVGVGGGFAYGREGFTHCGFEDIALMRSLPNMTVVVPADPVEARCLAEVSYKHQGPLYIRLGRTGEPVIHEHVPDFTIGKAMFLKDGKKVALFAVGNMVYVAKQVADMLSKKGIRATVINMHTIKPLDVEVISQVASTHEAIFSLEEHNINGGLGSAIAEVLAESRYDGLFKRFGIPNSLKGYIGSADYLRDKYGLTHEKIFETIVNALEER